MHVRCTDLILCDNIPTAFWGLKHVCGSIFILVSIYLCVYVHVHCVLILRNVSIVFNTVW